VQGRMKFVDVPRLNEVTMTLNAASNGDRRLHGRVECYSCKPAGDDKRLAKTLEQQFLRDAESGFVTSVGELSDPNVRRLLINLICTLNATFQDYDFSNLKADQFRIEGLGMVVNHVNSILSEFIPSDESAKFLEQLWSAIDGEVALRECEVCSYMPDIEDEPFSSALWSFSYFFHSRALKKIVFFTCWCQMRASDLQDEVMSDHGPIVVVPRSPSSSSSALQVHEFVPHHDQQEGSKTSSSTSLLPSSPKKQKRDDDREKMQTETKGHEVEIVKTTDSSATMKDQENEDDDDEEEEEDDEDGGDDDDDDDDADDDDEEDALDVDTFSVDEEDLSS